MVHCYTIAEAIEVLASPSSSNLNLELRCISKRNEEWDEILSFVKLRGLDRDHNDNVVPGAALATATRLFGGEIVDLARTIQQHRHLYSLVLLNCWVRRHDAGVDEQERPLQHLFRNVLPKHETLRALVLHFSRQDMTDDGHLTDHFLDGLTRRTLLESLTLINYTPISRLLRVIKLNAPSLCHLRLHGCMTAMKLRSLSEGLLANSCLRKLSIFFDGASFTIENDVLETLIGRRSSLEEIRLVNVNWSDEQVATMFELLERNTVLTKLIFEDDPVHYVANRHIRLPRLSNHSIHLCEEMLLAHNETLRFIGPFANHYQETQRIFDILMSR
jgi:hypothetical protein